MTDVALEYSEAASTGNILCEQCNNGYLQKQSKIINRIDEWVHYCKLVSQFINQLKKDIEEWTGSHKKKTTYQKKWKELSDVSFLKNDDSNNNLQLYVDYLNKGYGINGGTRAKAEFLLFQNLPNITELKIAKEIVISSTLNK